MTTEIRADIEIDAPAERVWAILTDFDAFPSWNPFITSITGDPLPGETLEVRIEPPGARAMTFRPTVRQAQPERELRWLGRLLVPGVFDGEHGFVIEPLPGGGVRFTQSERFSGMLVPLARATLRKTGDGFRQMNEALKRRAEGTDGRREGEAAFGASP